MAQSLSVYELTAIKKHFEQFVGEDTDATAKWHSSGKLVIRWTGSISKKPFENKGEMHEQLHLHGNVDEWVDYKYRAN